MPQKPNSYHGNSLRNSSGPGTKLKKMATGAGALNTSLNSSVNLGSSMNSSDFPWHDDKKYSGRKRIGSSKRRAPLSTAEGGVPAGFPMLSEIDGIDPDEELRDQLKDPLEECSRQRLRAVRISLRRLGGNVESRITAKELWGVFAEHNVRISGRIFQLILNKYEDQFGVDYEKLWKFMVEAQKLTGRDSVQATNRLNESFSLLHPSPLEEFDTEDINMLVKLHRALLNSTEFDLDEMRASCQERDRGRSGQLDKKQMRKICDEQHLPVHGALLNSLLYRCDDEKNGQISWPEVMTFLERAETLTLDPNTGLPDIAYSAARPVSGRLRPRSSRARHVEIRETPVPGPSAEGKPPRPTSSKKTPPKGAVQKKAVASSSKDTADSETKQGRNTPTPARKPRFDFAIGAESDKTTKASDSAQDKKRSDSPYAKSVGDFSKDKKVTETSKDKKVDLSKDKKTSDSPRDKKTTDSPRDKKGPESPTDKKVAELPKGRKTPESPREKIANPPLPKSPVPPKDKNGRPESAKGKDSPREKEMAILESPLEIPMEKKLGSTKDLKGEQKVPIALVLPVTTDDKTQSETNKPDTLVSTDPVIGQSTENVPLNQMTANQSDSSGVAVVVADDGQMTTAAEVHVSTTTYTSSSPPGVDNAEKSENNKEDTGTQKTPSRASSAKKRNLTKKDNDGGPTKAKHETKKPGSAKGRGRPPPGKTQGSGKAAVLAHDKGKKPGAPYNVGKDEKGKKGTNPKIPKNMSSGSLASYESQHSKGKTSSVSSATETLSVSTNSTNLTADSVVTTSNSSNSNSSSDNNPIQMSNRDTNSESKDANSIRKNMSTTSLVSMGETVNSSNEPDFNSSQTSELLKPLLPSDPNEKTASSDNKGRKESSSGMFKKSAGSVKNTGGFLSSVKSLFGGNKSKETSQELIPIVTVNSPEPSSESEQVYPPPGGATHELTVRGRDVTYYVPDMYYHKTINSYPPKDKLELDWIYGYRGNDCRCNIYMLSTDEVVYFIATYVIMYNTEIRKQRYYNEHTAEIRSMALHPNKITIATGQSAISNADAHIRVWQSDSLQTIQIIGSGVLQQSVMCLAFAQAQDRLVSIDNSDSKTMIIWDTNKGKQIAKTELHTDIVCQVGFHPKNPNTLVTVGREHQAWWTVKPIDGSIEEMMTANFEDKWMKAKYVICMMFKANGDLITGDSNGTIYVWHDGGNTISQAIKHAHEGPVFSLLMIRNHLVSGGRDGVILSWTWGRNFDQSGSIQLPKYEGGVRMLCYNKDTIFIGTTLNSILSCAMGTTGAPLMGMSSLHKKPLTQGHFDDCRALTMYPSNTQQGLFVTAGFDGIIAMFDAHQHHTVWRHNIKGSNIHCVDIHPNGRLLVLGVRDSSAGNSVSIISISGTHDVTELSKVKVSKDRITCIKFSPDGEWIAVGCYDRMIYILQVEDSGKKAECVGKCKGHNSAITGLDWSVDKPFGNYILQSSSVGLEHFYWDGVSCEKLENQSELRNIEWVSHNCLMGYPVASIHGSSTEGPMLYAVDRSYNHKLVATVTELQQINLYNYPCSSPDAQSKSYKTNNIETINIGFVYDNSYLVTICGKDTCILQWKIASS